MQLAGVVKSLINSHYWASKHICECEYYAKYYYNYHVGMKRWIQEGVSCSLLSLVM